MLFFLLNYLQTTVYVLGALVCVAILIWALAPIILNGYSSGTKHRYTFFRMVIAPVHVYLGITGFITGFTVLIQATEWEEYIAAGQFTGGELLIGFLASMLVSAIMVGTALRIDPIGSSR